MPRTYVVDNEASGHWEGELTEAEKWAHNGYQDVRFETRTGNAKTILDQISQKTRKVIDWDKYAVAALNEYMPGEIDTNGWSWVAPEFAADRILAQAVKDDPSLAAYRPGQDVLAAAGAAAQNAWAANNGAEDDDGFGSILGLALPIALMAFGVPPMLTSALGGGLWGSVGAGALIGGGTAALTGGDVVRGALLGGLGGGIGNAIGGAGAIGDPGSYGYENSFDTGAMDDVLNAPGKYWGENSFDDGSMNKVLDDQYIKGAEDSIEALIRANEVYPNATSAELEKMVGQVNPDWVNLPPGTVDQARDAASSGTRTPAPGTTGSGTTSNGMDLATVKSLLGLLGTGAGALATLKGLTTDGSGKLVSASNELGGAISSNTQAIATAAAAREAAINGAGGGDPNATGAALRGQAVEAADNQMEIAEFLQKMGTEQWDLYKTQVVPMLTNLTKLATTDRTAEEVASAAGTTKGAFATARQNLTRALNTTRSPADPGYGAALAPSYMDEASAVAKAIETARDTERQRQFDEGVKATGAWQTGQALPNQALADLNASTIANNAGGTGALNIRKNDVAEAQQAYTNSTSEVARRDRLAQNEYDNRAKEIARSDAQASQMAYGGFTLAKEASKWIDPKMFSGAINTSGGGGTEGWDYLDNLAMYADGGKVEGPGTGTSDSVVTKKRPGTYILSSDTVRAIGTKKIEDLAEKAGVRKGFGGSTPDAGGVPVRLSNGEYDIPPEVVQHYGEEFFDKLQQKYHRPVVSDSSGMANGGAIRKRTLPRSVEDAISGHVRGAIARGRY